jgi:hypothetical protein
MAGVAQSELRRILRDILDESPEKRTAFSSAMECDDGLLGKKLNGTNGRDVGLGELEALHANIVIQWFKRAGALYGLEVRERDVLAKAEELLAQFEVLMRMARLSGITPRSIKADLPASEPARRVG